MQGGGRVLLMPVLRLNVRYISVPGTADESALMQLQLMRKSVTENSGEILV
jgi:hypothetical protein